MLTMIPINQLIIPYIMTDKQNISTITPLILQSPPSTAEFFYCMMLQIVLMVFPCTFPVDMDPCRETPKHCTNSCLLQKTPRDGGFAAIRYHIVPIACNQQLKQG